MRFNIEPSHIRTVRTGFIQHTRQCSALRYGATLPFRREVDACECVLCVDIKFVLQLSLQLAARRSRRTHNHNSAYGMCNYRAHLIRMILYWRSVLSVTESTRVCELLVNACAFVQVIATLWWPVRSRVHVSEHDQRVCCTGLDIATCIFAKPIRWFHPLVAV